MLPDPRELLDQPVLSVQLERLVLRGRQVLLVPRVQQEQPEPQVQLGLLDQLELQVLPEQEQPDQREPLAPLVQLDQPALLAQAQ